MLWFYYFILDRCYCLSLFFFFNQNPAYEMRISDWSSDVCSSDRSLRESPYLSVGGGFVVTAGAANTQIIAAHDQLPFAFRTARELVDMCRAGGHTVAQVMLQNELTWRSQAEVDAARARIWQVMQDCVSRGCGINHPDAAGANGRAS